MIMELTEREYWKTIRKQKKIKLRQIAEVLGCSVAFISMYENDKSPMRDDAIVIYKQFINNK